MIIIVGKEGLFLFLDQEKAFDRVSHKALNTLLKRKQFPKLFRRTIKNIYQKDTTTAKVICNGELSPDNIPLNSGTRQGCPLSPLLFTLIAEIFNCNQAKLLHHIYH